MTRWNGYALLTEPCISFHFEDVSHFDGSDVCVPLLSKQNHWCVIFIYCMFFFFFPAAAQSSEYTLGHHTVEAYVTIHTKDSQATWPMASSLPVTQPVAVTLPPCLK